MGQFRVTVPKLMVESIGWKDVDHVILTPLHTGVIQMRRFIDGESLKNDDSEDRPGSDR